MIHFEKGTTEEFEQIAAKDRRGKTMFHWPLEFPEVIVKRGGFDAFVGNPPFMGCKYFAPSLGECYFTYVSSSSGDKPGRSDLCAYFFRRADALLSVDGCAGLLATNTVAQGDTQVFALRPLIVPQPRVFMARTEFRWPGGAAVYATVVHWSRNARNVCRFILNDMLVSVISEFLTAEEVSKPHQLFANMSICFQGSIPNADGLLLSEDEAIAIIAADSNESAVVKPYLTDINHSASQEATKWCIFFSNMTEAQARRYPQSFSHCEQFVKPVKLQKGGASAKYWWRFYRYSPDLQAALTGRKRVFVTSYVTKHLCFSAVSANQIFSNRMAVIADDEWARFTVIQSSFHEVWARQFSTTLKMDLTYTPTDCFETFPFCCWTDILRTTGEVSHEWRRQIMKSRNEGLTDTYNRFHNPAEKSADIQKLRDLHVEMDRAVAAAYGWADLELGHDFHETKQGIRFTISESARREVLQRLLKLNHERYAEEEKQGLHGQKGAAKKAPPFNKGLSAPAKVELTLFGIET